MRQDEATRCYVARRVEEGKTKSEIIRTRHALDLLAGIEQTVGVDLSDVTATGDIEHSAAIESHAHQVHPQTILPAAYALPDLSVVGEF